MKFQNTKPQLRRGCLGWGIALTALLLLMGGAGYILSARPELAASGADVLRAVLGDEAVASLEMVLFQAQDTFQQMKYKLGAAAPAAPWQTTPAVSAAGQSRAMVTYTPFVLPTGQVAQTSGAAASPQPTNAPQAENTGTPSAVMADPAASPTPARSQATLTLQATPDVWQPAALAPLGKVTGEGVWSPYLTGPDGRVVAYRTFLQPDPKRPFAMVAVIAFDLKHTRLHYMLGYEEPYAPDGPKRTGAMPEADKAPGRLLALFNGGFKATHGHFGAMSGGVVAIPARNDIGTLAIYQDGRVRMGVWGSSIEPSPDMQAWRQNGPLVVDGGAINPRIYNNSPKDWGYTVTDVSPTWRSGIGVSADGGVVYYFAGPSLTMEALGKSMVAAGAVQGMQLDINNYWVHFVAVREQDAKRVLEPLFPEMMKENIDRYLYPYSRDYFYVTVGQ